ncbi:MAG TPA: serine hydrolase domain-containing protein [Sphingobacteriaceae bacterium]
MTKRLLTFMMGAALLMAGGRAMAQQPRSGLRDRLHAALDSMQRVNRFPGATFSAVLPGGEQITLATGIADSSGMVSMKPSSRMLAGSIGKTFFAAAVLSLAEQGTIRLDDPISRYLGSEPWFHRLPNSGTITIRMLMNHTSGIEEYYGLGDFMDRLKAEPYRHWDPVGLFSYVFDRKPLFEAGQGWGYSDTNYLILGYLIEKQTGKNMYDLAKTYALKPNSLKQTEPSLKTRFTGLATGYSRANGPFPYSGAMVKNGRLVFSPEFEWTGGGFVSGSADLARWAKAYYALRTAGPGLREEMRAGIRAATGRDHQYGLGVQIRPGKNGLTYGHSGWFPGYVSDCMYDPSTDLAVAIQFNTDNGRQLKQSTETYLKQLSDVIAAFL